ncbi:MAG: response regulator, partial [bacterium]
MTETIKLLIVDDEVEFLTTISERLEQRGFDVVMESESEKALNIAQREKFDLALLDLQMPGMSGTELLDALKQEHKFLEVIILTGYGSVESAFECSKLGAFGYLAKPFDLDKLLPLLQEAFTARMQKKFEHNRVVADKISELAVGSSPLSILRAMKELD